MLRGAPPSAALEWCAQAVGRGATVVRVWPLVGGTSSAVHAVDVRDRAGRVHPLVLRRFVDEEWRAEEPDAPRIEATALTRAASLPLPTPRLVALGETDAIPLLLMTRLRGSLVWQPADVDPYLRRLAAVLPELHAAAVDAELPPYEPYALTATHSPDDSQLWRRAFEIFHGPTPSDERRILHRDYHPGNVLWAGGTISGIVDWASARIGPPPVDVGHCRSNLVSSLGMAAADRFLAAWLSVAGRAEYDPYWDVVAVLGGCGQEELACLDAADRGLLQRAVAER